MSSEIKNEPLNCWIRTVDEETLDPVEGVITGAIPEWLEGTLVRNGSGVFEFGDDKYKHLFDGSSVLHRFCISNGKATYQNRIQTTETYLKNKKANRITMSEFGTHAMPDPCKSILGRFATRFTIPDRKELTDNCSVNVCYFGDSLYTMTETSHIHRVNVKTLETIGEKFKIEDYVAVNHETAHPHIDEDGTVYNMGNSQGPQGPAYNIIKFPPLGDDEMTPFREVKIVASIPARWKFNPSYYHSFAITDNYFVFAEMPLVMNTAKLLTMNLRRKAFDSCMVWHHKENTTFHVVERSTGKLLETNYEAPGFFCFHQCNAFEKDGHIIVDLSAIKDGSIIPALRVNSLQSPTSVAPNSYATRYVLPLNPEKKPESENLNKIPGISCKSYWTKNKLIFCEPERLSEHSVELSRINYKYNGKEYRYLYGICFPEGKAIAEKVIKVDLLERREQFWERPGFEVSEPVFVARPGAIAEDDGVILFSALERLNCKNVLLVVVDAKSFQEMACVQFVARGTVSKDFHGIFALKGESVHRY